MKKKKLLIIAGAVLLAVIAALAAIPFFVDAGSLKTRIMSQLKAQLHREVSVQEAGITIFTGPGVRLKRTAIFDDPQFAAAPFITLDSLVVRPRLLPLLRGKIEVATIELDRPVIQLIRNAVGAWNFESLGQGPANEAGPQAEAEQARAKPGEFGLSVSLFRLRDGTVSIRKVKTGGETQQVEYGNIDLDLRNFSTGEAGSFQLGLELPGPEKGTLQARGKFGPVNFSQFQKIPLDGKIEFSNAPISGLAALLAPAGDTETQWSGTLSSDLQLQGTVQQGISADGKLTYAGLGSKRATRESPRVNGELQLKLAYQPGDRLTKIESAELRMPASSIKLAGEVKSEVEASRLNLRVNSPQLVFDDLIKLASVFGQGPPSGASASGSGQLALRITGSSAQPALAGNAQLKDVRMSYPAFPEKIALSPLTLTFQESGMSSNPFQISVGSRTLLHSQVAARFGSEGFVDLELRSQKPLPVADLLAIGSSFGFVPPAGTSVQNGTIGLQVKAKKILGAKPDLLLDGQATLNGSQVKTDVLKVPLDVNRVKLRFTGSTAKISEFFASLPGSNLSGQLQVSNFAAPVMSFALQVDRLDLGKLDQIVNTTGEAGSAATAGLRGPAQPEIPRRSTFASAEGQRSSPVQRLARLLPLVDPGATHAAAKPPDPLRALKIRDSQIGIDQVVYDQLVLRKVSSRLEMKDKILELRDLKFLVNQGTHAGSASFDFRAERPQYSFASKVQNVDANEFLSQNSTLKNLLYGKFSSDMELSGAGSGFDEIVKQLKGEGKVTLLNGRITSFNLTEQIALLGKLTGLEIGHAGTEIEDLVTDVTISNGRISTNAMHVRLPGMTLRANGSLGFDKSADYQISVELPRNVSQRYDVATQVMNLATATFFKNENGNVVLPLRMTGLVTSPRFALDSQVVRDNLKNSFRKDGVQKTLDVIQGVFKPKQSAEEETAQPPAPQENNAAPADKQPEKKASPWDLFRGIIDKTKDKNKDQQDKKPEEQKQP
jgi:uncharacterized protein involved in outer membrane biogenesis